MILTRTTATSSNQMLPQTVSDLTPQPPSSGGLLKRRISSFGSTSGGPCMDGSQPQQSCSSSKQRRGSNGSTGSNKSSSGHSARTPSPLRRGTSSSLHHSSTSKRSTVFSSFLLVVVALILVAGTYQITVHIVTDDFENRLSEVTDEKRVLIKSKVELKRQMMSVQQQLREEAENLRKEEAIRIQELETSIQSLQDELQMERVEHEQTSAAVMEAERLVSERNQAVQKFKGDLVQFARQHLESEFKGQPILAEFQVKLPNKSGAIDSFVVEMAPAHVMPLSVNYFVQQIKRGLWDDTQFFLNANHVMMARPFSAANGRDKRETFGEQPSLPFKEYHEDYPHKEFTLGFSGNPAGPEFYINKIDNSRAHGPSRRGEGEPCFAAVVKNQSVVEEMWKLEGRREDHNVLDRPVEIVNVRLLMDDDGAGGVKNQHQ